MPAMEPGLLLPLIVALATGWLAWRRETRRLDERSYDEPRGWDTSEAEFRDRVIDERKRRRVGAAVLSALAGSALAGILVQVIGVQAIGVQAIGVQTIGPSGIGADYGQSGGQSAGQSGRQSGQAGGRERLPRSPLP